MQNIISNTRHLVATLFAAAALCIPVTSHALPLDYYAKHSVMANGKWIRVRVTQNGMQQISHDTLREWGFSDPEKVTIFGYGGVMLCEESFTHSNANISIPDDLPQQPVIHTNGKMIFYGEADSKASFKSATTLNNMRNTFSDAGYYLITDSYPVLEPATVKLSTPKTNKYDWHYSIIYHEVEKFNPGAAGALFFDNPIEGTNPTITYDIPIPDYSPAKDYISFRDNTAQLGSSIITYTFPSGAAKVVDMSIPSSKSYDSLYYFTKGYSYSDTYTPTSDTYTVTKKVKGNTDFSWIADDYYLLFYSRYNRLGSQPQLTMNFQSIRTTDDVIVREVTPQTLVWDVTIPGGAARAVQTEFNEADNSLRFNYDKFVSITGTATGYQSSFIAFNPDADLYTPSFAGVMNNSDLHGSQVPDMLIITTPLCRQQAERLADIHRQAQGLDVLVVEQQEIFNEFSSATPHAMAIRRLCKMFYDRDADKFKYLLLFGGGSFDNRAITIAGDPETMLLTYPTPESEQAGSKTSSFTTDAFFAFMSDKNAVPMINQPMCFAVGRIPALTEDQAKSSVDKIEQYMLNTPDNDYTARFIAMADDGDNNSHSDLIDQCAAVITDADPSKTAIRAFDNIYRVGANNDGYNVRKVVTDNLERGVNFWIYAGHGNVNGFTGSWIWKRSLVKSTPYAIPPLAVLATCDAFAFDRQNDNIGENLIMVPQGGAIGIVAAGRTVYAEQNAFIALGMAEQSVNPAELTGGQMFMNTYNNIINSEDTPRERMYNTACYNFGGDPAIPFITPLRDVVITDINGIDPATVTRVDIEDDGEDPNFQKPDPVLPVNVLTNNHLEGYIAINGNLDKNFSGTAYITIYDAPRTKKTIWQGDAIISNDPLIDYTLDEYPLAETTVKIVDGKFKTDIYVPATQFINETNRITIHAVSDKNSDLRAAGYNNDITVVDWAEPDSELAASQPAIDALYIGTPDFRSGDTVDGNITMHAHIDGGLTGLTPRLDMHTPVTLSLDDKVSYHDVDNHLTGSGNDYSLTYKLTNLSSGRHTLRLTAYAANGLTASETIDFSVLSVPDIITLHTDNQITTGAITIDLKHSLPGEPVGRLIIEDAHGNTVRSVADCTFPYNWDCLDDEGNILPEGPYTAYAIVSAANHNTSSPRLTITIIHPATKHE